MYTRKCLVISNVKKILNILCYSLQKYTFLCQNTFWIHLFIYYKDIIYHSITQKH